MMKYILFGTFLIIAGSLVILFSLSVGYLRGVLRNKTFKDVLDYLGNTSNKELSFILIGMLGIAICAIIYILIPFFK